MDLPPGDPYENYVMVQDDTGVIQLELPEDWSWLHTESTWVPWPFLEARTEDPGGFLRPPETRGSTT